MEFKASQFTTENLGPCKFDTPFNQPGIRFIEDETERIVISSLKNELVNDCNNGDEILSLERGGPRKKIFFDPQHTTACIVTCGGLCPGLNDVIKTIVMTLYSHYGVKNILGVKYGYEGLIEKYQHGFVELTAKSVKTIDEHGGTILGSSRGNQNVEETVNTLSRHKIDIVFTIGGDGTQRGARDIADEIKKRGLKIAVVGIPKTIDNDVLFVDQTFGFITAVHASRMSVLSGHEEAKGARNGIAIVKLMGRDSGFIAAYASVANSVVNFCLIPEYPFSLHGEDGLLEQLDERLARSKHALIVVAEGAGQHLMGADRRKDASGNVQHEDIGLFLKKEIGHHFKQKGKEVRIKYIDPSYSIRAVPTNSLDSILCMEFGMMAVHAAMAGKTNMLVGSKSRYPVHVPIPLAVSKRKTLNPESSVFQAMMASTYYVAPHKN